MEHAWENALSLEENLYLDYFDRKQEVGVCTVKLQKNKEVSAVLLHGTLPKNSLGVLVVL